MTDRRTNARPTTIGPRRPWALPRRETADKDPQITELLEHAFRQAIQRWLLSTPLTVVGVMLAFWSVGETAAGLAFSLYVVLGAALNLLTLRSTALRRGSWLLPTYLVFAAFKATLPLVAMPTSANGQFLLLLAMAVSLPMVAFAVSAKRSVALGWPLVAGTSSAAAWAFASHDFDSLFPAIAIGTIGLLSVAVAEEGAAQQRTLAEASAEAKTTGRIDDLTGLYRRAAFMEKINASLETHGEGSLFFIDINRFKVINDTLGHQAGDQLLAAVAKRVRGSLREGDYAGRLGGDEIAVFVAESSPSIALDISARLSRLFDEDFQLLHHRVPITASIGVVCTDHETRTGAELMHHADTAMYAAKRQGEPVRLFDDPLHRQLVRVEQTELDLRVSLPHGEIHAHLQPVVFADGRGVAGFEALARWDRNGTIVPAADFFVSAQQSNLLPDVTRAVATELVELTETLESAPAPLLGVNVEVQDLGPFLDWLVAQPVDPSRWVIELTEHQIVDNYFEAERNVERAVDLRIGVLLDDYGKGYSSLTRILRLPLSGLKIDSFFVAQMLENRSARAIVSSAIHLASELDLYVIAEGVETQQQADELVEMGVTLMQGYHFYRPASIADSAQLLAAADRSPVENFLSTAAAKRDRFIDLREVLLYQE